jgi:hypothetical protein
MDEILDLQRARGSDSIASGNPDRRCRNSSFRVPAWGRYLTKFARGQGALVVSSSQERACRVEG